MLPERYRWLERESGPRMIIEALKEYGDHEAPGPTDNPRILGWHKELVAAGAGAYRAGDYSHDAIPWCGLFIAVIAHRANPERRPDREPPATYLWAQSWSSWGVGVDPKDAAFGDVLVFMRHGGGHVGLYVGHDAAAFHVLGGNQSDAVSIARIARDRLHAVRRPAYRVQPANVRPIRLSTSGSLSVNEA